MSEKRFAVTERNGNRTGANDLRRTPPRRWNAAIEGIVWLPRLIDKARACDAGTLGIYLFGQSPVDDSFLHAAGVDYATIFGIVRRSPDDFGVLAELDRCAPGASARLRAWTADPPPICRATFALIDADEGYARGPARLMRFIPQAVYDFVIPIWRRLRPFRADVR